MQGVDLHEDVAFWDWLLCKTYPTWFACLSTVLFAVGAEHALVDGYVADAVSVDEDGLQGVDATLTAGERPLAVLRIRRVTLPLAGSLPAIPAWGVYGVQVPAGAGARAMGAAELVLALVALDAGA